MEVKMRIKITVCVLLIVMSVGSALATTRTISSSNDNIYTMIRNSNGNYWEANSNNIQVAIPTTPANMFHLLRRQVKMNMRLPLVIFTPKSLLRHPQVQSKVEDLASGCFQFVFCQIVIKPS